MLAVVGNVEALRQVAHVGPESILEHRGWVVQEAQQRDDDVLHVAGCSCAWKAEQRHRVVLIPHHDLCHGAGYVRIRRLRSHQQSGLNDCTFIKLRAREVAWMPPRRVRCVSPPNQHDVHVRAVALRLLHAHCVRLREVHAWSVEATMAHVCPGLGHLHAVADDAIG